MTVTNKYCTRCSADAEARISGQYYCNDCADEVELFQEHLNEKNFSRKLSKEKKQRRARFKEDY